jgi:hypothetical protein
LQEQALEHVGIEEIGIWQSSPCAKSGQRGEPLDRDFIRDPETEFEAIRNLGCQASQVRLTGELVVPGTNADGLVGFRIFSQTLSMNLASENFLRVM